MDTITLNLDKNWSNLKCFNYRKMRELEIVQLLKTLSFWAVFWEYPFTC